METLEEKITRVLKDEIVVAPYNPDWPARFEAERRHLVSCLPPGILGRIEHFGSTAVPGLAAKPIVDMLIEVSSHEETKRRVVPILESRGYDYFWRPSFGDSTPPFYAWFIKRDDTGRRTHHLHMVEADSELWARLRFRDHLIEHPEVADAYAALKTHLSTLHRTDREAYTAGKSAFIAAAMSSIPMT